MFDETLHPFCKAIVGTLDFQEVESKFFKRGDSRPSRCCGEYEVIMGGPISDCRVVVLRNSQEHASTPFEKQALSP